ncbi:hypothetical protein [Micromonospora narathiwatensis]|uniref:Uncharacterized protein n=1 Tax=Micromonospora narathiwatensis TaxID=299146 RepID=A0A1A9ACP0_9ACTN|nr:hypothetical protein [Micromonospora narathiwatensis]SBT54264.1 hypothetical protein GA0070621_5293 [Micromonospora narathiwatensis]
MRSFREILKSKLIPLAVAAVVVGGGATAASAIASAAPAKNSATSPTKATAKADVGDRCTLPGRVVKNKRYVGESRTWPRGAKWRATGNAKGTVISLQHETRVHNSVSATFGLSKSVVSAAVGFNVEKQQAVWVGFNYTQPKAGKYQLRVTPVYDEYLFEVHNKVGKVKITGGHPACIQTGTSKVGTGAASKYIGLESRVYRQDSAGQWVVVR